jgi:hypothetical protein
MTSLRERSPLQMLGAALVLVVAGVHFQQYIDFMAEVPKVGVLFLLNAAGGAGLAVALLSGDRTLRLLAALGSLGLVIGSLISIVIALEGNFLGYSEPTLRFPIVLAMVAEIAVLPVIAALLRAERALPGAQPAP